MLLNSFFQDKYNSWKEFNTEKKINLIALIVTDIVHQVFSLMIRAYFWRVIEIGRLKLIKTWNLIELRNRLGLQYKDYFDC